MYQKHFVGINVSYFRVVICVFSIYFAKQTGGLAYAEFLAHG